MNSNPVMPLTEESRSLGARSHRANAIFFSHFDLIWILTESQFETKLQIASQLMHLIPQPQEHLIGSSQTPSPISLGKTNQFLPSPTHDFISLINQLEGVISNPRLQHLFEHNFTDYSMGTVSYEFWEDFLQEGCAPSFIPFSSPLANVVWNQLMPFSNEDTLFNEVDGRIFTDEYEPPPEPATNAMFNLFEAMSLNGVDNASDLDSNDDSSDETSSLASDFDLDFNPWYQVTLHPEFAERSADFQNLILQGPCRRWSAYYAVTYPITYSQLSLSYILGPTEYSENLFLMSAFLLDVYVERQTSTNQSVFDDALTIGANVSASVRNAFSKLKPLGALHHLRHIFGSGNNKRNRLYHIMLLAELYDLFWISTSSSTIDYVEKLIPAFEYSELGSRLQTWFTSFFKPEDEPKENQMFKAEVNPEAIPLSPDLQELAKKHPLLTPAIALLGTVIALFTGGTIAKFMESKMNFSKELVNFSKIITSLKNVGTAFSFVFEKLMGWIAGLFGLTYYDKSNEGLVKFHGLLNTFQKHSTELLNLFRNDFPRFAQSTQTWVEFQRCYHELQDLYSKLALTKTSLANLRPIWENCNKSFDQLMNYYTSFVQSASIKQHPTVLWVYGRSGVGKSHLTTQIMTELSRLEGKELTSYTRGSDDEFSSGYFGQDVYIFDDFSANQNNRDHGDLNLMYSDVVNRLNMAALDEKGMLFCSRYIIIYSNFPAVERSKVLTDPAILLRRRDLLFLAMNPEAIAYQQEHRNNPPQEWWNNERIKLYSIPNFGPFPNHPHQGDAPQTVVQMAASMRTLQVERRETYLRRQQQRLEAMTTIPNVRLQPEPQPPVVPEQPLAPPAADPVQQEPAEIQFAPDGAMVFNNRGFQQNQEDVHALMRQFFPERMENQAVDLIAHITTNGAPLFDLTGDPGTGKTRALLELQLRARALGKRVLEHNWSDPMPTAKDLTEYDIFVLDDVTVTPQRLEAVRTLVMELYSPANTCAVIMSSNDSLIHFDDPQRTEAYNRRLKKFIFKYKRSWNFVQYYNASTTDYTKYSAYIGITLNSVPISLAGVTTDILKAIDCHDDVTEIYRNVPVTNITKADAFAVTQLTMLEFFLLRQKGVSALGLARYVSFPRGGLTKTIGVIAQLSPYIPQADKGIYNFEQLMALINSLNLPAPEDFTLIFQASDMQIAVLGKKDHPVCFSYNVPSLVVAEDLAHQLFYQADGVMWRVNSMLLREFYQRGTIRRQVTHIDQICDDVSHIAQGVYTDFLRVSGISQMCDIIETTLKISMGIYLTATEGYRAPSSVFDESAALAIQHRNTPGLPVAISCQPPKGGKKLLGKQKEQWFGATEQNFGPICLPPQEDENITKYLKDNKRFGNFTGIWIQEWEGYLPTVPNMVIVGEKEFSPIVRYQYAPTGHEVSPALAFKIMPTQDHLILELPKQLYYFLLTEEEYEDEDESPKHLKDPHGFFSGKRSMNARERRMAARHQNARATYQPGPAGYIDNTNVGYAVDTGDVPSAWGDLAFEAAKTLIAGTPPAHQESMLHRLNKDHSVIPLPTISPYYNPTLIEVTSPVHPNYVWERTTLKSFLGGDTMTEKGRAIIWDNLQKYLESNSKAYNYLMNLPKGQLLFRDVSHCFWGSANKNGSDHVYAHWLMELKTYYQKSGKFQNEALQDPVSDSLVPIIMGNYVNVMRQTGKACFGIMIHDHLGVTVSHACVGFKAILVQYRGTTYEATVISQDLTTDRTYFLLPSVAPACVDIRKHLIRSKEYSEVEGISAVIVVPERLDAQHIVQLKPVFCDSIITDHINGRDRPGFQYSGHAVNYRLRAGVGTTPGDCGSVILGVSKRLAHKFLGIHSAANTITGLGVPIFLEDLPKMNQMREIPLKRRPEILPHHHLMYCDEGPIPWSCIALAQQELFTPHHTNLHRSPFPAHLLGLEDVVEPSILSAADNRLGDRKPAYDNLFAQAMEKWFIPLGAQPDWERVGSIYKQMGEWFANVFHQNHQKIRVLTEREAFNGASFTPNLAPITMDTSAGYPYSTFPGASKKKTFVDIDANDCKFYSAHEHGQLLKEDVALELKLMKEGRLPFVLHTGGAKDELLKKTKIYDSIGTRGFVQCPLSFLINHRRYFGAVTSALHFTRDHTPFKIGINPLAEWDQLYSYLEEYGSKGWDGDFKGWDASVPRAFMYLQSEFYNRIYQLEDPKWTQEDDLVRRVMYEAIADTNLLVGKHVYQTEQGHPSGTGSTGDNNNLPNLAMHCYIFCDIVTELGRPDLANFWSFIEYIRMAIFGDDHICVPKPEIASIFTYEAVRDRFARWGVILTAADKETEQSCKPVQHTTFLSREVTRVFGKRVGRLQPKCVSKALFWCKGGARKFWKRPDSVTYDRYNLEASLRNLELEVALVSPRFYDTFCQLGNQTLADLGSTYQIKPFVCQLLEIGLVVNPRLLYSALCDKDNQWQLQEMTNSDSLRHLMDGALQKVLPLPRLPLKQLMPKNPISASIVLEPVMAKPNGHNICRVPTIRQPSNFASKESFPCSSQKIGGTALFAESPYRAPRKRRLIRQANNTKGLLSPCEPSTLTRFRNFLCVFLPLLILTMTSKSNTTVADPTGSAIDDAQHPEKPSIASDQMPNLPPGETSMYAGQMSQLDPYLYNHYFYGGYFSLNWQQPAGTILWTMPVHPDLLDERISYFTRAYNVWQGGMTFRFKCNSTALHGGAVIIGWCPPNIDPKTLSVNQLMTFPYQIFDPRTAQPFGYIARDMRAKHYHMGPFDEKNPDSFGGYMWIAVRSPLIRGSDGNETIQITYEECLDSQSFQVAQMIPVATQTKTNDFEILNTTLSKLTDHHSSYSGKGIESFVIQPEPYKATQGGYFARKIGGKHAINWPVDFSLPPVANSYSDAEVIFTAIDGLGGAQKITKNLSPLATIGVSPTGVGVGLTGSVTLPNTLTIGGDGKVEYKSYPDSKADLKNGVLYAVRSDLPENKTFPYTFAPFAANESVCMFREGACKDNTAVINSTWDSIQTSEISQAIGMSGPIPADQAILLELKGTDADQTLGYAKLYNSGLITTHAEKDIQVYDLYKVSLKAVGLIGQNVELPVNPGIITARTAWRAHLLTSQLWPLKEALKQQQELRKQREEQQWRQELQQQVLQENLLQRQQLKAEAELQRQEPPICQASQEPVDQQPGKLLRARNTHLTWDLPPQEWGHEQLPSISLKREGPAQWRVVVHPLQKPLKLTEAFSPPGVTAYCLADSLLCPSSTLWLVPVHESLLTSKRKITTWLSNNKFSSNDKQLLSTWVYPRTLQASMWDILPLEYHNTSEDSNTKNPKWVGLIQAISGSLLVTQNKYLDWASMPEWLSRLQNQTERDELEDLDEDQFEINQTHFDTNN